jgi:hypothetical protein
MDFEQDVAPASDFNALLGRETYEWKSSDGLITIKYGRPKGLASVKVASILGAQQSANFILVVMCMAIEAIREINGEPFDSNQVASFNGYRGIMSRFGDLYTADKNFNEFALAWQHTMHPETYQAMREATDAGEPPEVLEHIASQQGVATAKKSRTPRS